MDRPGAEYLGDPVSRDRRLGGQIERPADPPVELAGRVHRKVKQLHSVSLPVQASKFLPPTLSPTGCPYSYSPTWTPTRRDLVGSLVNEAVVTENGILEVVPGTI